MRTQFESLIVHELKSKGAAELKSIDSRLQAAQRARRLSVTLAARELVTAAAAKKSHAPGIPLQLTASLCEAKVAREKPLC